MIEIIKKYHFYAAHRNTEAGEKCGRIHGHTYDVNVILNFPEVKGDIAILFSEIDNKIENIIKSYDHYFLIYEFDFLCKVLEKVNEPFIKLPFITSAENLSKWLFMRIKKETGLPIKRLELAETKSSIVAYEE